MRKNQVKGIINDLLNLEDWKNPLQIFFIENKFKINLLNGEIEYLEEDSVSELYKEKINWFIERIKNLKGDLKDFEKAEIVVFGKKEKIEIVYKGEKFEGEVVY